MRSLKPVGALLLAGSILPLFLSSSPARAKPAPAKEEVAVIETSQGRMVLRFFGLEAPGHVAYVKQLMRQGFYDGTTFHRVIPHFVIQGGDPNSRDEDRSNDGEGEGDRRLKAEFSQELHYRPGTVGMARDSDPDSGSCQFFIALESLPRLDGRYTIFGELIEGLEVARKIAELPRDLTDNPLEKVPMKITLKLSKVPGYLNSLQKGEDTSEREVLTGPGKPRPWDPGSSRWTSPALIRFPDTPLGTEAWPAVPLDLAVDAEGRVLDVRFGRLEVPQAAAILQSAGSWRFRAARYDGQPVKSRFSMDSRGGGPGPSQAPGTPRQIEGPVREPSALVVVPLPPNVAPPAVEPLLRLTVDEAGHVSDVELQVSCGVAALDEAAMEAARRMEFKPALDGQKPVPVYLNLSARFVKAPAP